MYLTVLLAGFTWLLIRALNIVQIVNAMPSSVVSFLDYFAAVMVAFNAILVALYLPELYYYVLTGFWVLLEDIAYLIFDFDFKHLSYFKIPKDVLDTYDKYLKDYLENKKRWQEE